MLSILALASLAYTVVDGRKRVSREIWIVVFLIFCYFTYSFVWSLVTVLYTRSTLFGSVSNFTFTVEDVTNAYLVVLSGLSIAVATCGFLERSSHKGSISRAFSALPVDKVFWFSVCVSLVAFVTLGSALRSAGSFSEAVKARYANNGPLAVTEVMFGLPLAIALISRRRSQLVIASVVAGLTMLAGLFSGKTTFIALALAPVLVVYMAQNLTSLRWFNLVKAFFAVVGVLLLLQGYRAMRNVGEGGREARGLQITNSFGEILVFSRVIEVTSLSNSYLGIAPAESAFYTLLPRAVGGEDKEWYLTHWRTSTYVGRVYFNTTATMPITVYGDGFLMYGRAGVAVLGLLIGGVMYLSALSLRSGAGGATFGLFGITALVNSARNGVFELTLTLLYGVLAVGAVYLLTNVLATSDDRVRRPGSGFAEGN